MDENVNKIEGYVAIYIHIYVILLVFERARSEPDEINFILDVTTTCQRK